jgi:tetratricopeptide (TPR) repeat protein
MAESEYVTVHLREPIRDDGVELENLPIPIRADQLDRVIGREAVHLDLLLDELFDFLLEHKDQAPAYATFVGQLAYMVGYDMAKSQLMEGAEHYLEIGLKLNPDNLNLLVTHAVALHTTGRFAEALAEYERALAHPMAGPAPLVAVLAARCCRELGQYERGYRLLESLIPLGANDPKFVEFAVEMGELGNVPRALDAATQNEISSMLDALRQSEGKCGGCGAQMRPGARFCAACGKPGR